MNSNKPQNPQLNIGAVTSRTFKCFKCKNYTVKVVDENGGTAKVCNAKINDPRIIVDLEAPNCTDYVYGW
jgi:hypothetical protein